MLWIYSKAVQTFLKLKDTIASYSGLAGKLLKVNSTEDGVDTSIIKESAGNIDIDGTIGVLKQTNAIDNLSKLLQTEDIFADFVVTGLLPATSSDLTSDISAGKAYVSGVRVVKAAVSHTYTASKDTYVDISSTGTYTFTEVDNGAAAPAVAADSIRLAKVVTDSSAITSVTDLANRPKIYVDANGNVGIGTTAPEYPLTISGSDRAKVHWNNTATGGGSWVLASSDDAWALGGGKFVLTSNGGTTGAKVVVDSSGNVGIGTTGPSSLLDVNGTAQLRGAAGGTGLFVDSSGNVGIGTTNQFGGGARVIGLHNAGTNPSGTLTDAIVLYASGGELYVLDAGGTATQLSPHAKPLAGLAVSKLFPAVSYEKNLYLGLERWIAKGKAFELVQELAKKAGLLKANEYIIKTMNFTPKDVTEAEKEKMQHWKSAHKIKQEISKDLAFEDYEAEEDTKEIIGQEIEYKLEGTEVKEVKKPVYKKNKVTKKRLRQGVQFDSKTGKFYEEIEASDEEALKYKKEWQIPDWIKERVQAV